jgi:purine-binding chemotaxis protein CheW
MTLIGDAAGVTQYLAFQMTGEEYAVELPRVREIIQLDAVTRVPSAPPWVTGVVNLRGSVVPVVDLAVKFGMEPARITRWTCLVIVEVELDGEPVVMGVLADTVSQVLDLAPGDIEPPPAFGTRVGGEHLLGMARQGNRFALLLDLDRVLTEEEAADTRAAAEADEETAPSDGVAPEEMVLPGADVDTPDEAGS